MFKVQKTRLNIIIITIFALATASPSQTKSTITEKQYQINYKTEASLSLALYAANVIGLNVLKNKTSLTSNQISLLDIRDIWQFDRRAVEQSYSVDVRKNYWRLSDWSLNVSIILPSILLFDHKIRKDILDVLFLYFEAQAIQSSFYTYGGVMFTNRLRPYVYYPNISLESKYKVSAKDSFFSGHTSTAATSSFFIAKIIDDAHPELGNKKWLIYGSALIPPFIVGYSRYRALMHFPTDVLIGIAVGALVGIMIPRLHKMHNDNNQKVFFRPDFNNSLGISVVIKM